MDWLWLILLGFIVGSLSGFFGVGGGVLLVPMLVYAMDYNQKKAQGTSLAVLCVPVVAFAAFRYYQKGYVELNAVGWIILGFLFGSIGAASVVDVIPSAWLRVGFAALLTYVGLTFFFSDERRSKAVLPAAVATGIIWLLSLLWKRKHVKQPATEVDIDYHI